MPPVLKTPLQPSCPTAFLLMGLQACGKTSFYQRHLCAAVHINLDSLGTRSREAKVLDECLRSGRSFAVDNTNPRREDRRRYVVPAKEAGFRIEGFFFRSRVTEAIKRNETRPNAVPTKAILGTSAQLELPSLSEGFDGLHFVSIGSDGEFLVEEWRDEV